MIESSTPPLAALDDYGNVTDLLVARAAAAPDHVAFEVENTHAGAWKPITTRAFSNEVRALAKGFMARGIQAGDPIAIMAPTRYEWAVADLAAWFAGAVVVPIYDTSSPSQVKAIVADAGVRLAIGGTAEHAQLLQNALTQSNGATLGAWTMDVGTPATAPSGTLADLVAGGIDVTDEELEARRTTATQDDPATIVYTSGTTGEPKGVVLTHRNFLGQVLNIAAAYHEIVNEDGNTVIFLPLAHVLARGLQLICLASGMRIAHLSDPSTVVAALDTLRPTFLVVVPRVLQKIQAAAATKASDKGLAAVWAKAHSTAIAWGRRAERIDAGRRIANNHGLRLRHRLFDAVFYRRLRTVMGGRVEYILSGGAALDTDLSLFFRGIGVPVIEGYGLTETTAPLTGNLPGRIASGSVGAPLPGLTVRISDEGEVLARGVGVFGGYRNPMHDEGAFVDGFFRTGDLGRLDEQGRLILEGRIKDVIVTSNGKTIVPTRWESAVEANPLVSHAVMVGEGKPYLSALLVLDPEQARAWADAEGISFPSPAQSDVRAVNDPTLHAHLQGAVDAANALVARSEQVRRFSVVFADLDDRGLVTPTMKLKRSVVLDRAAVTVEDLYL
ncbi:MULTISPECIES: long-chain fatty acid--CoA ligase [unclassified Microbacterium]|uniref:AMP-dependent synthetase/ligase n=1 Tax=unclassified Microbacterium TaxID=2609290 RepID=UPI000CFB7155|nr:MULTISPECIES: AMP-dependent synthetase/ligase [unclassified Microbacterium]PQZ60084.1 long-chain fatty acid--CoA ligase [Microbacterium sp. MYb43]PQZ79570.1 long-chain fatty acid--CoA ligase [Microbacterium sp. MYb40]PRB23127.1 long-chain fatty acid--CoA ligase [Microbacterium sp. MYb54]PRB27596.1 long-chain fatty acid--CoA ligase [Microbacterium sp. MYb50]PRB65887.1 long-chain fatty acid--CoA ligase [Microbacterium sp. MYb24]